MRNSLMIRAGLAWAVGIASAAPISAQQKGSATMRDRAIAEAKQKPGPLAFGVIDGIVTDTLLRPLQVSDVTVVGTGARVTTSASGKFRFLQVPAGQYLLVVRRIGYAPTSGIVQVRAADTLRLSYALARSVSALDTIRVRERRVSTRMMDFEARRFAGVGQFLTQEEIEKRGSLQVYDYLRNMRGIEVSRQTDQGAFGSVIALSRREGASYFSSIGSGACAMQVFLDGIVLPQFFNLELLPPPKQIAGIEVYSGSATTPPQFGGASRSCGVIAVWTRDGY